MTMTKNLETGQEGRGELGNRPAGRIIHEAVCLAVATGDESKCDCLPADYGVVVTSGKYAGNEVTFNGVPWRGTLTAARRLARAMVDQAEGFGHTDARYMAWRASGVATTCGCGHIKAQHDEGGCWYHACGCVLTPEGGGNRTLPPNVHLASTELGF